MDSIKSIFCQMWCITEFHYIAAFQAIAVPGLSALPQLTEISTLLWLKNDQLVIFSNFSSHYFLQMISLYRDPKGENVFSTSDPTTANQMNSGRRSSSRTLSLQQLQLPAGGLVEDSKVLIQKLETRVSQLKEELDQCSVRDPVASFKIYYSLVIIIGEVDLVIPMDYKIIMLLTCWSILSCFYYLHVCQSDYIAEAKGTLNTTTFSDPAIFTMMNVLFTMQYIVQSNDCINLLLFY